MKKLLLKSLFLLCALVVGSGSSWATINSGDYSAVYTSDVTLSTTGGTSASTCKVRLSATGTQYDGIKAGTGSNTGKVQISVPAGTKYLHLHAAAWNGETVTLSVKQGSTEITTISLTSDSGISNSTPFTLNTASKATTDYYKVVTFTNALEDATNYTFTATGGKRFVIWGVNAEALPTGVTLKNGDDEVTSLDMTVGDPNVTLTAIVAPNTGTNAKASQNVTWASDDTGVATVVNGVVHAVAAGTAHITATSNTDDSKYASCTVTVSAATNPSIGLSTTSIAASSDEAEGTINITYNNITSVDAEVLFYESDGTTAATYDWLDAEINATDNTKLDYAIGENTGAARTAYMKVHEKNEDVYSGLITISQEALVVEEPTFNLGTGTYTSAQSVTLDCPTVGATIHYTMTIDGTTPNDPTESDATYSSAISVTKNGTKIKAKAFKGEVASTVASATYTIKPNKPTITAAGATVTITADDGCDIYYTIDNSDPSKSSTHYTGPFNLDDDCPIKAVAYDAYDNASDYRVINYVYLPLEPKNINSNHYVKVTDVNTLENGDAVLIVCESGNVAMSTTQNANNRGQAEVTISNNTIDNPDATVQKLVLMKIGNYFYFYTGSGFLYAASSSSNYLKTETTPDDNAKATIAISSGDVTITFQGNYTHNVMKHNGSSSLFSCYLSSSDQDAIQIYKEVPAEPSDPVVSGSSITLTTTAKMAGWRTFAPVKDNQNYTADADVYYVSAAGSSSVTLVKIDDGVPANTPVILHQTSGTDITLTETDATITAPGASNLLAVSTAGENLGKVYRLGYKSAHGVGFYTYTTTSAPAGIVYINPSSPGHEFLGLDFDGETTGVNEVTNTNLTNNTNEFYNLAGQRVAQPTKGLYIVNGKKVIVK